tara:strand:- start:32 stop:2797 length:2766 start_codon:yes stop_codon:yes gene_type:complete
MAVTAKQNGYTFTYEDGTSDEYIDDDLKGFFADKQIEDNNEDIPQIGADGETGFSAEGQGGESTWNPQAETTPRGALQALVSGMNRGALELADMPMDAINAVYRQTRRLAGDKEVGQGDKLTANISDVLNKIPSGIDGQGVAEAATESRADSRLEKGINMGGTVLAGGVGFSGGVKGVANALDDAARLRSGTGIGQQSSLSRVANDANFTSRENIATGGASLGSTLAETVAPGSLAAQVVGQVGGSLATPPTTISNMARSAKENVIDPFTNQGVERRLSEQLRSYSSDPSVAIDNINKNVKVFKEVLGEDVNIPSTLLAEDAGLSAAYIKLSAGDPAILKSMNDFAGEADALLVKAITRMRVGDVGAETATKRLDKMYSQLNTQMASRMAVYEKKAAELVEGVKTGKVTEETSVAFRTGLENMAEEYAKTERKLWRSIPEAKNVDFSEIKSDFGRFKREQTKERWSQLDGETKRLVRGLGSSDEKMVVNPATKEIQWVKGTDTGDMQSVLDARSIILEKSRQAKAEGNHNKSALLRETEQILSTFIDSPQGIVSEGYRRAAAMTRRKHEVFTQGSIGNVRGYSKAGDMSATPEGTLQRLTPTGDEGAAVGQDIQRLAMGDAIEQVPGDNQLVRLTEGYIADKFAGVTDTTAKRARFFEQYGPLLRQFPSLQTKLVDVSGELSTLAKETARQQGRQATKNDKNKHYAAKLLNTDPAKVPRVLENMNGKDLKNLVRLVGRDKNAMDGLRNSVLESLVGRLINTRGETGGVFLDALYTKSPQLKRMLNEVLTPAQLKGLSTMNGVLKKTAPSRGAGTLPDVSSALKNSTFNKLMARLIGARTGAAAASGSSALLAANAAANFSESLANSAVAGKTTALLTEALNDPELMKRLLRPVNTAKQTEEINTVLRGHLITLGYEDDEPE